MKQQPALQLDTTNEEIDLSKLKKEGDELTFVKPVEQKTNKIKVKVKVKRIHGVSDIEIEENGSWCSVCGDGSYKAAVEHTSSPRPMIRLKLRKEDAWICYECIKNMNKSLKGCKAKCDSRSNLINSAVVRLRANLGTEGHWRKGAGDYVIYPDTDKEVVTVYDSQKVIRKKLTFEQEWEKGKQKRRVKESRQEAKRDRQHKKDCIRGYSIHGGQRFAVIADGKYDHLLPENRQNKEGKIT